MRKNDLFGPLSDTFTVRNCDGRTISNSATFVRQRGPYSREFMIGNTLYIVPDGLWMEN